jgi:hypothetical protein
MSTPIAKILNIEWYNQNAMRAFPIADGCTELDTTSSAKLPRELIVDLLMPVDSTLNLDTSKFYVSQVAIFGPGVTVIVSYDDGSTVHTVGTVSVNASTHTANKTYFLVGEGIFEDCIGKITIGRLEESLKIGAVLNFNLAATQLVPTLFRPDIRGVKSIRTSNGTEESVKLFGDLIFRAGQNFRLRVDSGTKTIYFDALKSTDLNDDCGCDSEVDLPPAIRTINGVPPDGQGNFQFVPDACMEFTPAGVGTLEVHDTCSEPCCGSPELKRVEEDFNQLNLDVRTMRTLLEKLEGHLIALDNLRVAIQSTGLLGDTPPGTE